MNLNYCKFDCPNYQIPFEGILTYDNLQRKWSNPTIEQIRDKQEQFLKILPYKEVLRDEFKIVN